MKARTVILIAAIGLILIAGAFSAGFIIGRIFPAQQSSASALEAAIPSSTEVAIPQATTGTPEDLQKLFEPFWQAWNLVQKQYVEQPVDQEAMMRGAIRGML